MTAAELAGALPKGRKSRTGYIACCPAHDDNNPSLSIADGDDGKPLVHCHAGCSQVAVIAALSTLCLWSPAQAATDRDIRHTPRRQRAVRVPSRHPAIPTPKPEKHEPNASPRIVATYDYTDESGGTLYQVVRFDPKDFRQRYPDGTGGWIWKKHDRQVLYRLPEVLAAEIVFVVEGERDVETLRDHGFVGTTKAGGANSPWLESFTESLQRKEVIVVTDRDSAGYACAKRTAQALLGKVGRLAYVELEDGKDTSEWFARGHSEVEFINIIESEKKKNEARIA